MRSNENRSWKDLISNGLAAVIVCFVVQPTACDLREWSPSLCVTAMVWRQWECSTWSISMNVMAAFIQEPCKRFHASMRPISHQSNYNAVRSCTVGCRVRILRLHFAAFYQATDADTPRTLHSEDHLMIPPAKFAPFMENQKPHPAIIALYGSEEWDVFRACLPCGEAQSSTHIAFCQFCSFPCVEMPSIIRAHLACSNARELRLDEEASDPQSLLSAGPSGCYTHTFEVRSRDDR